MSSNVSQTAPSMVIQSKITTALPIIALAWDRGAAPASGPGRDSSRNCQSAPAASASRAAALVIQTSTADKEAQLAPRRAPATFKFAVVRGPWPAEGPLRFSLPGPATDGDAPVTVTVTVTMSRVTSHGNSNRRDGPPDSLTESLAAAVQVPR